jgi:Family of unknown function (DUF6518)
MSSRPRLLASQPMSRGRQLGLLLLAGLLFGVLVAAVKGQDVGVRDALGNTSAPWVVVPFLAGTRYARVWQAALVGVATTLAALCGFYLAEAAILDLGPHPWTTDLRLTLGSGQYWVTWGLLSGSVYGALGGLWASRWLPAAAIAVGLAFVAEPLIVLVLKRADIWGGGGLLDYPWMWITEIAIGLCAIAYAVTRAQARVNSP